jgi:coatomer subunit beta'
LAQLDVVEKCLRHAVDMSGLFLLRSTLVDVEGMQKLAILAREHGKNNVGFQLSLFLLGEVEACMYNSSFQIGILNNIL